MKHIQHKIRSANSDYLDKGWLDMDAIMELMMDQEHKDDLRTDAGEFPQSDQEKTRRKVIALMELLEIPEVEKDQLLNATDTNQQLEDLHRRWTEKVNAKLAFSDSAPEDQSGERWQDFTVYRNGGNCGLS
ncbi:hypothetical protein AMJ86_03400 [bacterium SM23_57]|nr:MAG: hypothetical protein AMJ86_03400 [bacterium SM23_57]